MSLSITKHSFVETSMGFYECSRCGETITSQSKLSNELVNNLIWNLRHDGWKPDCDEKIAFDLHRE